MLFSVYFLLLQMPLSYENNRYWYRGVPKGRTLRGGVDDFLEIFFENMKNSWKFSKSLSKKHKIFDYWVGVTPSRPLPARNTPAY